MTSPEPLPAANQVGPAAGRWWQSHGLNAREVAERLRHYGFTAGDATMSRLKNGDEAVSIERWLALSMALRVPPLALLFPQDASEGIEVAPGVVMAPTWAWEWAVGDSPPPSPVVEGFVTGSKEAHDADAELRWSRQLVHKRGEAIREWRDSLNDLVHADSAVRLTWSDAIDEATQAGMREHAEARRLDAVARCLEAEQRLADLDVRRPNEPTAEAQAILDEYAQTSQRDVERARQRIRWSDAHGKFLRHLGLAARAWRTMTEMEGAS